MLGASASSQLSKNGTTGGGSASIASNNYSTPKALILRNFEELHAVGEILFYCHSVITPSIDDVRRLQVLTSVVSGYVTRDDYYGEGFDSNHGTLLPSDSDSLNDYFLKCTKSRSHSFLISLQMTHVASLKILAARERSSA